MVVLKELRLKMALEDTDTPKNTMYFIELEHKPSGSISLELAFFDLYGDWYVYGDVGLMPLDTKEYEVKTLSLKTEVVDEDAYIVQDTNG